MAQCVPNRDAVMDTPLFLKSTVEKRETLQAYGPPGHHGVTSLTIQRWVPSFTDRKSISKYIMCSSFYLAHTLELEKFVVNAPQIASTLLL